MKQVHHVNYGKVQKTAYMVAYLRSFTDIPYASQISKDINAFDSYADIFGSANKEELYRAPRFEVRFKSVSNLALKYGTKNLIELGSGFSPRGLIFSENLDMLYVEADIGIDKKRKLTEEILHGNPRHNLRFEELNVLDVDHLLEIARSLPGPVTIICEGLLIYLNRAEQKQLAQNINKILKEKGGVWITPDFATTASRAQSYGTNSEKAVSAASNVDIIANSFRDEAEIVHFFNETNFKTTVFDQLESAGYITSGKILNLDNNKIEKILSGRKVYILRVM